MSSRTWRSLAFGSLFILGGMLSDTALPLAGAPLGSAGAVLAGPVMALICNIGMATIMQHTGAVLAVKTWCGMNPGQRRTVLLGAGAWLLWRSFRREMR